MKRLVKLGLARRELLQKDGDLEQGWSVINGAILNCFLSDIEFSRRFIFFLVERFVC